jgi:Uma2 family endonuclease
VAASGNAYYPDASVVCGSLEADPTDQLSILNPSVLVEVLSPTTAGYDTAEKLQDYLQIPSVQHVVHVHHDARRVTVHTRRGGPFAATSAGPGETVHLDLVGATLTVDEIYFDPLAAR